MKKVWSLCRVTPCVYERQEGEPQPTWAQWKLWLKTWCHLLHVFCCNFLQPTLWTKKTKCKVRLPRPNDVLADKQTSCLCAKWLANFEQHRPQINVFWFHTQSSPAFNLLQGNTWLSLFAFYVIVIWRTKRWDVLPHIPPRFRDFSHDIDTLMVWSKWIWICRVNGFRIGACTAHVRSIFGWIRRKSQRVFAVSYPRNVLLSVDFFHNII